MTVLHTARMRLEPVAAQHLDGIHVMNRIPEVTRYISGAPDTPEQTSAWIAGVQRCWAAWGTSWWALIEPTSGRVAGAGCIQYARREAELPADLQSLLCNPLEIGWRLHPDFWAADWPVRRLCEWPTSRSMTWPHRNSSLCATLRTSHRHA